MNETQDGLRMKLMENGMSWEDAQDEIDNLSSEAYDREQDKLAEQHFRGQSNERTTI